LGQPLRTDLSQVIAENFGANATYVEGLLSRFRSNPELVDESWRAYFDELLGDSATATAPETSSNGGTAPQVDSEGAALAPAGGELDGREGRKSDEGSGAKAVVVSPAATPTAKATVNRHGRCYDERYDERWPGNGHCTRSQTAVSPTACETCDRAAGRSDSHSRRRV